jgi:hypothetical protein
MYLHWVRSPDNKREACNGGEEGADFLALGLSLSPSIDSEMPDDDQESDARNGVPSPLLGGTLASESSKEAGQDHDDISDDGHQNVGAIEAREQAKVEQKKRSRHSPVHVTGPEDLAFNHGEGVRDVVVLMTDLGGVNRDSVAGCHGEVGDGSRDGDDRGDDMVESTCLENVSRIHYRFAMVHIRLGRATTWQRKQQRQ